MVSTWLADGLPQSPSALDTTWPRSVVTAPPDAFWNGIGMSTCWRLGHSNTAPAITATPMATSSPTTILAGSGPSGDGPDDKLCECECVTRSTVEARC